MISDAPDGYELSKREELAPLVHDFHELVGRDLSNGELLALDFALEWVFQWAEDDYREKLHKIYSDMNSEYAVIFGIFPQLKTIEVPNFEVARRVAQALGGQISIRQVTRWEAYKEN